MVQTRVSPIFFCIFIHVFSCFQALLRPCVGFLQFFFGFYYLKAPLLIRASRFLLKYLGAASMQTEDSQHYGANWNCKHRRNIRRATNFAKRKFICMGLEGNCMGTLCTQHARNTSMLCRISRRAIQFCPTKKTAPTRGREKGALRGTPTTQQAWIKRSTNASAATFKCYIQHLEMPCSAFDPGLLRLTIQWLLND